MPARQQWRAAIRTALWTTVGVVLATLIAIAVGFFGQALR